MSRTTCMRRFSLAIDLEGHTLQLKGRLPHGLVTVVDILPAIRKVTDALMHLVPGIVAQDGKRISCRAGCGACCCQAVPVSIPEMLALKSALDALPLAARRRIRRRFRRAAAQLRQRRLIAPLRRAAQMNRRDRMRLGIRYFRLGIACPFLEAGSCGIRALRPLACREYFVTSPLDACAELDADRLEVVQISNGPSTKLFRLGHGSGRARGEWIPLILLLEWWQNEGQRWQRKAPAAQLFSNFVEALLGEYACLTFER